jgi:chemotaxis protein methyltransferase CheR
MGAFKLSEMVTSAQILEQIATRIMQITGVQLGEKQKALVEGRLSKRLRDLKLSSIEEYAKYLVENEEFEVGALISLMTTHHTYFFREFSHFEFVLNDALPRLIELKRKTNDKTIRVWSAACSRGQEVYSLAMYLKKHLPMLASDFTFEILGTDVDKESVAIAANGVYPWDEVKSVPVAYLQGNWVKGTGEIANFVKVKNELKAVCRFETLNLLNLSQDKVHKNFDLIFCRNVFIYFEASKIQSISTALAQSLSPAGRLFIGLSESLNGLDLPLKWVGPSVYAPLNPLSDVPKTETKKVTAPTAVMPAPLLRVLCVDDSPTVLTLLKKMLNKEAGFEVVGTAANGLDAREKVKSLKPDLLTLDIHMPEQNGVEYLRANMSASHPPVLVVSSVSREDSSLGQECIRLGAMDYVEKPSLENFAQRSEEIRMKLKASVVAKAAPSEIEFKNTSDIAAPEKKLRLVFAPISRPTHIAMVLKDLKASKGVQPPTIFMVETGGQGLATFITSAQKFAPDKVALITSPTQRLENDKFYFYDWRAGTLASYMSRSCLSFLALAGLSEASQAEILRLSSRSHLVIEDAGLGKTSSVLSKGAQQIVPLTSFAYESVKFFLREGKN